jgi:hypothetical protein
MKKLVLITAVIACAAMVMAQTVTSQNIVGYSKEANDSLQINAAQFWVGAGNTTTEVYGDQLPVGSKVYVYVPGSGYGGNIATYQSVFIGGTARTWNRIFLLV